MRDNTINRSNQYLFVTSLIPKPGQPVKFQKL